MRVCDAKERVDPPVWGAAPGRKLVSGAKAQMWDAGCSMATMLPITVTANFACDRGDAK